MKIAGKKLYTDILADRNREEAIGEYQSVLATAFRNYASIKLSMNLFTMYDRLNDIAEFKKHDETSLDRRDEISTYLETINYALAESFKDDSLKESDIKESKTKDSDSNEVINEIIKIRDQITSKMKMITYYVDAFEIYEYILQRKEPAISNTINEEIDIDDLVERMYTYVFSDDDKMVINVKIQGFIAQLPVRMTKNHFYDVLGNSLAIYRGSEKKTFNNYVETIKDNALINKPENAAETFPKIDEALNELKDFDYKTLDDATYKHFNNIIESYSDIMSSITSDYLALMEIINDALIVLYTNHFYNADYLRDDYKTAASIVMDLVTSDDPIAMEAKIIEQFSKLEGKQEEAYETLASLDANLDTLSQEYYGVYGEEMDWKFDILKKTDLLTSSSMFMDIDQPEITVVVDEADEEYINQAKAALIQEFTELFERTGKLERRSTMAKVLSYMPVFFNTKQEIKDYFKYALSSCTDKSELSACNDIITEIIMYDSVE